MPAHKLEPHSITSLSHRLKLLVSRATLRKWIKDKKLIPESIENKEGSKYLIFSTRKLDDLLTALENGFTERLGRLARIDSKALAFRARAEAEALELINKTSPTKER